LIANRFVLKLISFDYQAEEINKVFAVQENLVDLDFEIAVAGRSLKREGTIIEEEKKKKSEPCHLLLFNDLLLLTRPKGQKYHVRQLMQLCDIEVMEEPETLREGSKKFGFKVQHHDSEYILCASSADEKVIHSWNLDKT